MYKVSEIAKKARELCEKFPDTIYEGVPRENAGPVKCLYTKGKAGDGCGCIVGQAAILAYPELKSKLEEIDNGASVPYAAAALYKVDVTTDTNKDVTLLNSLQSQQDKGKTWGESLTYAEEYVKQYAR